MEKHHVLPKCLGGTDDRDNIVTLTPEEHFVAHQLLVKLYPGNRDLVYAAQLMTTHHTTNRVSNKLFGWLRKQCALVMSIHAKKWYTTNEHPRGMAGKKHDVTNICNIVSGIMRHAKEKRVAVYAYNLDGTFYKKYESLNDCAKDLGTSPSNVKYTAEGKFSKCKNKQLTYEYSTDIPPHEKVSHLKGRKKSDQHIANMKIARETKYTCVHCGFLSSKSAITRFHNDNCKSNPCRL